MQTDDSPVAIPTTIDMASENTWLSGLAALAIVPFEIHYVLRMISFFFVGGFDFPLSLVVLPCLPRGALSHY